MGTSFGALCSDFYVNLAIGFKMPFESRRDSVLSYFDRIRSQMTDLKKFRMYSSEMSLESPHEEGSYRWMSLLKQEIRCGNVNPDTMTDAYGLHELVLNTAPYYVTHSLLDLEFMELLYGFDLECKANHNQVVAEALLAESPLGRLMGIEDGKPFDIQPSVVIGVGEDCQIQASFDVKTRTTPGQIRRDKFRPEPISVFLSLKRTQTPEAPEDLVHWFKEMTSHGERLCNDYLIPNLLTPINEQIIGTA